MKAKRALLRRTAASGSRIPDQAKSLVCPNQRTSQTATPSPLVSLPQRLIHRLNVPETVKKATAVLPRLFMGRKRVLIMFTAP